MGLKQFLFLFLMVSFVLHGIAFTFLGWKRRKIHYFFLTGTFIFLTAIYFINFEGWILKVPGTDFPVTWLLRIGATLYTLIYLRFLYREEDSWFRKLTRGRGTQ